MINAKIIADSISEGGVRITTFELEYPRFIHSELMTHRVFSRNAASSRAIPLSAMIKLVWDNMAEPIHWGRNQSGMQSFAELAGKSLYWAQKIWRASGYAACGFAWLLGKCKLHKQIANRILEPWSHIKVVVTSTTYDNWFHLRKHNDAQPEIHKLADEMWLARENSTPKLLKKGEWHLPYIKGLNVIPDDDVIFCSRDITLSNAIKLSASLCAQVSYRRYNESVEKAIEVYDRLVNSEPVHASPFEHQATPATSPKTKSGNFTGWIQNRQLIKNNVCTKYKPD